MGATCGRSCDIPQQLLPETDSNSAKQDIITFSKDKGVRVARFCYKC